MYQIALYKRLLSYLFPIRIKKSSSTHNEVLELFVYKGHFQLATPDAIYSDGVRYRPMKMAFKHLDKELDDFKQVLLLGAGLSSAKQILTAKGFNPKYTIVDIDNEIISISKEVYGNDNTQDTEYICADAEQYMKTVSKSYDLIVVDIFNGRVPAEFVTEESFLLQCRKALNNNGVLVLNYIINGYPLWEDALEQISTVLPSNTVLKYDINRIVIARV